MAGKTGPNAPWTDQHQVRSQGFIRDSADVRLQAALIRRIVQVVLNNRPTLYTSPELSDVAYHGGDVINRKTKQILTAFAGKYIVANELGAARSNKTGSTPSSPRKGKSKDGSGSVAGSPTKKRKAEVKVEDEDELYSE